ncbi:hypothetical protein ACS8E3_12745 [Psychrobacter sp. 2Y5]|uniref:hypothetical protein n=1 Tax=unclassified Psychrobacter TaxID=196806 RepID=UPI003F46AE43
MSMLLIIRLPTNRLKTSLPQIKISPKAITYLVALGLSLTSLNSSAHDPNTATLILSKSASGEYLVQLNGALTGVEAQINQTYSKEAYQTAEQFEDLARKHFVDSLTLVVNDQHIAITNPIVQLGHGTQFMAKAQGVPKTIESIELSNTFFKDLHGNKMTVVFLSDQLSSSKYVLNDKNNHHLSLTFKQGQWWQNDR